MNRRWLIGMLSLSFSLACSSNGSAPAGTGGKSSGSGGASSGSGGTSAGSGGATPGSGGATPGSGGTTSGSGGASTGSGGATTGSGGGSAGERGGAGGRGVGGSTGVGGRGGATGGGGTSGGSAGAAGQTSTNVLQFHHNLTRDGVYVDAGLTRAGVANMHIDTTFAATAIMGPVYAQPLYLGGAGTSQPDMIVVATAQNRVYALNAATGAEVWPNAQFGTPVTAMLDIPGGNRPVNPYGIFGTPVIDGASRTLYFDAMTTVGTGARHRVHAVDLSNGMEKSGWPVNVDTAAMNPEGGAFQSAGQNQRAALAVVGGRVFVPYSGFIGDAGDYHGWVVGISTTTPTDVKAWSTRAPCGGIWGTSGIASDGTSIFFVTGNTKASVSGGFSSPSTFGDGEAVYKLGSTLARPTATTDFFAPSNWAALDQSDTDLGGTGVILLDVPGATPSSLVLALGKDGIAYLLNRTNLGGVSGTPVATRKVAGNEIIQAGAAYTTPMGTYFVFKGAPTGCPAGTSGGLMAVKVGATSPPTLTPAWCAGPNNAGNAIVSMSDAQGNDAIVWYVGSDNRLYAVNGDTGASVLTGAALMLGTVKPHQTPIVAKGRVIVSSDSRVYALTP